MFYLKVESHQTNQKRFQLEQGFMDSQKLGTPTRFHACFSEVKTAAWYSLLDLSLIKID